MRERRGSMVAPFCFLGELRTENRELLFPNLSQNRSRFGRRVRGFRDGTPYNDMRSSGGNRFRWRDDARLIVVSASCRTHSRSHDSEIMAKLLAQSSGFLRGRDDSLVSV